MKTSLGLAVLLSVTTLPMAQAPPPSAASFVYLSDLTPTGTPINGYGPYEKDRSNGESGTGDGMPMKIGRTAYKKGLGVHPSSDLTFSMNKKYDTFSAIVGLDDELLINECAPKFPGSVVFQVFVDGAKMFDSGVVSVWSPAKAVEVDVKDKNLLRLVVRDGDDGYVCDHADWADAKLTAHAKPGTVPGSVLSGIAADSATAEVAWTMPRGGTSSNTTWPQAYLGQSEPGGRYTGAIPCGVTAQIDTYPVDVIPRLIADGLLTMVNGQPEDDGIAASWRYVSGEPCVSRAPVSRDVAPFAADNRPGPDRLDSPGVHLYWSTAGRISGKHCVNVNEPSDESAAAWEDDYLCSDEDLGLAWSFRGPTPGKTCVQINEPSDQAAEAWEDNFLCTSKDAGLAWNIFMPLPGMSCLNLMDPLDRSAYFWTDNYLCAPAAPRKN